MATKKSAKKRAKTTKAPAAKATSVLAELATMSMPQLRARYEELYGAKTTSHNNHHLRRAIAKKLKEIGAEPVSKPHRPTPDAPRDPRLPAVGTVLKRSHDGVEHRVIVKEHDFEYEGKRYRSLSAIAKEITGTTWNGFLWFGLVARRAGKAA